MDLNALREKLTSPDFIPPSEPEVLGFPISDYPELRQYTDEQLINWLCATTSLSVDEAREVVESGLWKVVDDGRGKTIFMNGRQFGKSVTIQALVEYQIAFGEPLAGMVDTFKKFSNAISKAADDAVDAMAKLKEASEKIVVGLDLSLEDFRDLEAERKEDIALRHDKSLVEELAPAMPFRMTYLTYTVWPRAP